MNPLLSEIINFMNLVGTVGVLAYVIRLEHRITALEIHVDHLLDEIKTAARLRRVTREAS